MTEHGGASSSTMGVVPLGIQSAGRSTLYFWRQVEAVGRWISGENWMYPTSIALNERSMSVYRFQSLQVCCQCPSMLLYKGLLPSPTPAAQQPLSVRVL